VYSTIKEIAGSIREHCREQPSLGLILGSGLGSYAELLCKRRVIPFSQLPHFPSSTVRGHPGNLIIGNVEDTCIIVLQGRIHLYEGYSISEVALPTRVLGCLGIRQLIVTNAAGGINPAFKPGDLMLITDHINMMWTNPLIGINREEWGPRFPDMSEAYDPGLREIALRVARDLRLGIRQGIYIGFSGPSYETPAEIRMCRMLGADAVGMSTIPEVIVANHMGIRVLGISCIANMAAGILPQRLTHEHVMNMANKVEEKVAALLGGLIPRLKEISD
jgi:purine-nucleoside phosphorylase